MNTPVIPLVESKNSTPPDSELVNSDPSVYEIGQMLIRHQLEQAEALKKNTDNE